ncbi:hypothetical protein A2U01_0028503, partial [Trifolium medium]|nr:hypothetical protein [Trifolium medium]
VPSPSVLEAVNHHKECLNLHVLPDQIKDNIRSFEEDEFLGD